MDDEWNYIKLDSYKPALSMLFNSFILAQVGQPCPHSGERI